MHRTYSHQASAQKLDGEAILSRNSMRRHMKRAIRLLGVCAALIATPVHAQPKAVVELFTSQGCSSCPPADELLEQLSAQDGILALSLPVDYWDYLGWKDTLASRANSNRQHAYAEFRGDRAVYTPQMVINGGEHVIGSKPTDVKAALERADPLTTHVALSLNDMAVEARIKGALPKNVKMATVFFGMLEPRREVPINRGENAGETVTYVNVAHHLQPIGMWSGGDEIFRMPMSEIKLTGMHTCVVLVQIETETGPSRILGAQTINWTDNK